MERKIYGRINSLLENGRQAALVTIVNATKGTPRKIGTKMLVEPDGSILGTVGGGGFEKQLINEAVEVCKKGEPVILNRDLNVSPGGVGAVCGGQVSIFIDPILKSSKMFIFGAGHVGKAIAELAGFLDFRINVIDSRTEWANEENYPGCKLWTGNEVETAKTLKIDKNSYVIILTRSWKLDEEILKALIKKEYAYLGLIGSDNKIRTHREHLMNEGFEESDFSRIYAPIGIPIGAYSPHEIAISILAEIIAVKKQVRDQLPGWKEFKKYGKD